MRKTLGYIVLILALAVFIISSVDDLTRIPAQAKYASKSWWGSDKYNHGDLYGMSYLPQFKATPHGQIIPARAACQGTNRNLHVYAVSDSYTWDVFGNPANICGASESGYAASNFFDQLPVHFDPTARNIIVIEANERNVLQVLNNVEYLNKAIHVLRPGEDTVLLETAGRRKSSFRFNFNMKDADANFEFNLWDYRFLTPIKELKAWITYKWFNRTAPDVVVSPDEKYLFYNTTVDSALHESSFKKVSDAQVNEVVNNLNKVYDNYKHQGFDEVYLAIIPNPVSVLSPNLNGMSYNHIIQRVQENPNLKMRAFDSYHLFNNSVDKGKIYSRSDTHWTLFGEHVWLDAFNKEMMKENEKVSN